MEVEKTDKKDYRVQIQIDLLVLIILDMKVYITFIYFGNKVDVVFLLIEGNFRIDYLNYRKEEDD